MNATAEKTKHTPGPWVAAENDPDGMDYDKIWITTDDRLYRSVVPIAEVGIDYSEPMNGEQLANAAFIVRAVNCHDDLLAALKEARQAIAEVLLGQGYVLETAPRILAIDAVIAKAEAQS